MNLKLLFIFFAFALTSLIINLNSVSAYTDNGTAFLCENCSDCINALNNNTYNFVYLNQSITNHIGTCIDNPTNFSNKTFDCQNYLIDGERFEDLKEKIKNQLNVYL